ncbi:hypothetical protein RFI_22733 [Reticulomyxa filosa]|uniref:SET domain-containing protein n=1 Tax=Reticulomyxa filosa TaxID=46433 RepID=X6ML85_RETFI|nr:hypothetical protein RFI_22733 [Reticulomyxa filosa]|eukprot:ETO14634.1 hypothetical protein RFI_22733 [Reticulomyxa filosa]
MSIGRFVNHNNRANISNYNVLNKFENGKRAEDIMPNPSDRKWLSDPSTVVHWDCIAMRDIQKGEEITQNYNELDSFQWPWFVKLYERYETDRFEEGEWVKGSKQLELMKQKQAENLFWTNKKKKRGNRGHQMMKNFYFIFLVIRLVLRVIIAYFRLLLFFVVVVLLNFALRTIFSFVLFIKYKFNVLEPFANFFEKSVNLLILFFSLVFLNNLKDKVFLK